MRIATRADVTLSNSEIQDFLHNAQLALCENVDDERIPAVFYLKNKITFMFSMSKLTPCEIACALVSSAFDIFHGGEKDEGNNKVRRIR